MRTMASMAGSYNWLSSCSCLKIHNQQAVYILFIIHFGTFADISYGDLFGTLLDITHSRPISMLG